MARVYVVSQRSAPGTMRTLQFTAVAMNEEDLFQNYLLEVGDIVEEFRWASDGVKASRWKVSRSPTPPLYLEAYPH